MCGRSTQSVAFVLHTAHAHTHTRARYTQSRRGRRHLRKETFSFASDACTESKRAGERKSGNETHAESIEKNGFSFHFSSKRKFSLTSPLESSSHFNPISIFTFFWFEPFSVLCFAVFAPCHIRFQSFQRRAPNICTKIISQKGTQIVEM